MIRTAYRRISTYNPKVAIIGGGTGGLSVCAQLIRKRIVKPNEIVVLEPNQYHSYFAYSTMIAAGFCGKTEVDVRKYERRFCRSVSEVFPKNVTILKNAITKIEPDKNIIMTQNGDEISYKILVASPGLENDFNLISGADEALKDEKSAVGSIYDGFSGSMKVNRIRQEIKSGKILFSNALPPARCAGAPLKVCFLFEDYFRKIEKRDNIQLDYYCSSDSLFSIPEYAEVLLKLAKDRNINVVFNQVLTSIDKDRKIATFKNKANNQLSKVAYDFMHFSPHFKPNDAIKESSLAGPNGLITVDSETLQHKKYSNVFSLGDGSNVPANKTAAAITAQAPIVVKNIQNLLEHKPINATYNGYTVCPVFVGNNKMLFTESLFGYPYYSYFKDNMEPKWFYYFFNRYLMPRFYWRYIPRGKWHGSKFIISPRK